MAVEKLSCWISKALHYRELDVRLPVSFRGTETRRVFTRLRCFFCQQIWVEDHCLESGIAPFEHRRQRGYGSKLMRCLNATPS